MKCYEVKGNSQKLRLNENKNAKKQLRICVEYISKIIHDKPSYKIAGGKTIKVIFSSSIEQQQTRIHFDKKFEI